MVDREKHYKKKVLFEKQLTWDHYSEQAAKLFAKFVIDNPYYPFESLHMEIKSTEMEEDYYGNGGGTREDMHIFQYEEEAPEERQARIGEEEQQVINDFQKELKIDVRELVSELNYKCPTIRKNNWLKFLKKF